MIPGLLPLKVIEVQTLSGSGQFDFTSINTKIPAGSRHLVVLIECDTDRAADTDTLAIELNSDTTGSNYHGQRLSGIASSASADRADDNAILTVAGNPSDLRGGGAILIPHAFNTTNHKAILALGGGSENGVAVRAVRWANVAAITALTVKSAAANLLTGSIAKLCVVDEDYAIPGAELILTSDGTFTFDGLPQGRGGLSFIGHLRGNGANTSDEIRQVINDDATASNYARQRLSGLNSTPTAGVAATNRIGISTGANSDANIFSGFLATYQQHSLGNNDPHWLSLSGFHDSAGPLGWVEAISGRRNNVEAVKKIVFAPLTGTAYVSGSMMSAYFVPKMQVGYHEVEASAGEASITFTLADLPIPAGVTDLRLNFYARTDVGADNSTVNIELNGDTTASNYDSQQLQGLGSAASAARSAADKRIGSVPGGTATANQFSGSTVLISEYAKTDRHKHLLGVEGLTRAPSTDAVVLRSLRWENTAAINEIKILLADGSNFVQGSIFELEAVLPVGGEEEALVGVGPNGNPQVHIDWGDTGDFSGANDEITGDVLEIPEIKSGRNFPSTDTGQATAGRITVMLKNIAGNYSPLNTSAAEAGNIVPKRKVRVRMTSPFTRDFIMYLDTIVPRAQLGSFPTATLTASGPIRSLTTNVNVALQKAVKTQIAVGEVLDKAEWSATLRDLETGVVTLTRWAPGQQSALSLIRQLEKTEDGFFHESLETGGVVFENRDHRFTTRRQQSQATFTDSGSGVSYRTVTEDDVLALVFTDIRATLQIWPAAAALADVYSHPEANTTGDAPRIAANGGTLEFFADIEFDPAIDHIDAWTTPTLGAGDDIEVWSVNDQTGTNLSTSDISIAVSKFDTSIKIVLTNNHATLDGFMTVADIRGTAVAAATPVTVFAQDEGSDFGLIRFPDSSTPRFLPSSAAAQEWADWNLSVFKTPTATTRIAGSPRRSLLDAHAWLRRDVSDRITQVSEGSQTKLGINQDMYVEGIRVSFKRERQAEVTLLLSDAAEFSDGWIVGRSLVGKSTKVMRSA